MPQGFQTMTGSVCSFKAQPITLQSQSIRGAIVHQWHPGAGEVIPEVGVEIRPMESARSSSRQVWAGTPK
jgi:hypothetical protein